MLKRIAGFVLFLCLFCLYKLHAQEITPERMGFRAYSIHDKELGAIHFYVSSKSIDKRKPVLLYLDGSGSNPLFQKTDKGIASSVALNYRSLSDSFHVVLISKPGVPFFDTLIVDTANGYSYYPEPEEYTRRLSLPWRVGASQKVLKHIQKNLKVNSRKVVAFGISEGFQVGTQLAATDPSITHLIAFVGNGLNQFFDFVIHNRILHQQGELSFETSQQYIDSLMLVAKDIYENPNATDRFWYGHTYLRWSSFTQLNPTESILSLTIPVYLVGAANDLNTSVLGLDYLQLERIRRNKTNITYRVYPYDHALNEWIKDSDEKVVSVNNHLDEVITEALQWLHTK